jgi:hypothetical protein
MRKTKLYNELDKDEEIKSLKETLSKIPNKTVGTSGIRLWKNWISTNVDFLYETRNLTQSTLKFVLESFLFLINHPESWNSIKVFTGAGFPAMNEDVNNLMKNKESHKEVATAILLPESREFFNVMTSIDLPIIPTDLHLQRCMYSTDKFSPPWVDSFDSYRTMSTSLSSGKCVGGHGFEEKTLGTIYMYLICHDVSGLLINFEGLIEVQEYEVILPPGLRFTWNKNMDELKKRMKTDDDKGFANGEYKVAIRNAYESDESDEEEEILYEYHRLYDVTVIPLKNPRKRVKEPINCERETKDGIRCLQNLKLKIGHECISFCQSHLAQAFSGFFTFLLTKPIGVKQDGKFTELQIHENRILIKTKTRTSYFIIQPNVLVLNGVHYFENITEFVEFCLHDHIFESPFQLSFTGHLKDMLPHSLKNAIYLHNNSTKVFANIQNIEYDETLLNVDIDIDFV